MKREQGTCAACGATQATDTEHGTLCEPCASLAQCIATCAHSLRVAARFGVEFGTPTLRTPHPEDGLFGRSARLEERLRSIVERDTRFVVSRSSALSRAQDNPRVETCADIGRAYHRMFGKMSPEQARRVMGGQILTEVLEREAMK